MEKKIVGIGSFYKDTYAHINSRKDQRTDLRLEGYRRLDRLLEAIQELDYEYQTIDKLKNKIDYLVYFDTPEIKKIQYLEKYFKKTTKKILIVSECEMIRPANYSQECYDYYNKILTWDDDLIDGEKYIKSNTNYIDEKLKNYDGDRKDFTLIAANKKCWHPNELYSERRKIIDWFSKNCPDKLDLFGPGWDLYAHPMNKKPFLYFNNKIFKIINKKLGTTPLVWKGVVKNKVETLRNYNFTFALENAKNYNGYILEKIFDPMFAGSIPIYLGAKNIEKYIPPECYINYTKYQNMKVLYDYCTGLTAKEIECYRNSIENFLNSKEVEIFHDQYFKKQIKILLE